MALGDATVSGSFWALPANVHRFGLSCSENSTPTCWAKVSDQALLGGGQETLPNTSILSSTERSGVRIEACPEPVEGGAGLQQFAAKPHPSIRPSLRPSTTLRAQFRPTQDAEL